jgi:hypothetical protein
MMTPLLPQAFWFRLAIPCRRIDDLPRSEERERLLELPASCRLPATAPLDGLAAWADVRAAWNPGGLAIAVEATTRVGAPAAEDMPAGTIGIQVWVDTRDTRSINRASRFCHRFTAYLQVKRPRRTLGVELMQRPISRAMADAPTCRRELLQARAEWLRAGWRIELFLPAEAMHGFDPDVNRRLGFAYQVSDFDPERQDQFLGVGREFPVGENPSLWSTLELREPD